MIFSFFYDKNDSFFFFCSFICLMIYKLHCMCVCFRFGAFFRFFNYQPGAFEKNFTSFVNFSISIAETWNGCERMPVLIILFCLSLTSHQWKQKKKSIGTSLQVKAAWKTNLKKREWDIRNILIWNFCHFVLSSKTVLNLIFFPWYVRCAKTYTHSESMPTILHSSFGMWMLAILFYGIATILRQLFFFMLIVLSFFF